MIKKSEDTKETKEVKWCSCGKVLGHKDKCLSIKWGVKERIGRYSGFSKSEYHHNEYK